MCSRFNLRSTMENIAVDFEEQYLSKYRPSYNICQAKEILFIIGFERYSRKAVNLFLDFVPSWVKEDKNGYPQVIAETKTKLKRGGSGWVGLIATLFLLLFLQPVNAEINIGENEWLQTELMKAHEKSQPADYDVYSLFSNIRDIHFLEDETHGWAVGDSGTILATKNGGQSWLPQPSEAMSDLNSITFLSDGLHGWVAGKNGTILATTDGGSNWLSRKIESDISLHSIR